MSKYIDLHPTICADMFDDIDNRTVSIISVLEWLDDNPDQVPGRTITEGEVLRFTRNVSDRYARGVNAGLILAGVEITPDPEPTNAEKLETALRTLDRGALGYSLNKLARDLDKAGVKAPTDD